ncbi:Nudix hydrolase 10 [Camellia lanceoleosa]|nr:Nudix hydrolase 10 [Camellia lanceoleosa]
MCRRGLSTEWVTVCGRRVQVVCVQVYEQFHKSFFDKSDLFFLCMLHPPSFNIQKQEFEIEATQVSKLEIPII